MFNKVAFDTSVCVPYVHKHGLPRLVCCEFQDKHRQIEKRLRLYWGRAHNLERVWGHRVRG